MRFFKGGGGRDRDAASEAARLNSEKEEIGRALVIWRRWCMRNGRPELFPKLEEFEVAAKAATTLAAISKARDDFTVFVKREKLVK